MELAIDHRVLLLISAPFVGSFLGVVIERLPAGRPVLFGRSSCAQCGHVLGVADLVPVASWLINRAKCRYCHRKVAPFYPAIEIAALLVAIWSLSLLPGWIAWAGCGLGWTLLVLAVIDERWYLLPSALTLPLTGSGLLVAWLIDPGAILGRLIGASGGILAFVVIAWLYRRLRGREGLGGGDVWLLGALGAWVGWQGLPTVVLYAGISGLLWTAVKSRLGNRLRLQSHLAFGPHLCLAGWLVWLYGPLWLG